MPYPENILKKSGKQPGFKSERASMKFEIDIENLVGALDGHIAKRSAMPIIEHVLIEAIDGKKGGSIRVVSTDTEMEFERRGIPATVDEGGSITCHAVKLQGVLSGLSGQAKISIDGNDLLLAVGRRKFKIPALPATDFPDAPKLEASAKVMDLDPDQLCQAIKNVSYAASTQDPRFYFMGVCVDQERVTATDGISFASQEMGKKTDINPIIIPNGSLPTLTKVLSGEMVIICSHSALEATSETVRFRTNLVDAIYPDYMKVIRGSEKGPVARLKKSELIASLRRSMALVDVKNKVVDIGISATKTSLKITDYHGNLDEYVSAEVEPGFEDLHINAMILMEAAQACGDTIKWINPGDMKPQMIFSDEKVRHLCVVIRPGANQ